VHSGRARVNVTRCEFSVLIAAESFARVAWAGYVFSATSFVEQPDSAIQMIIHLYEYGPIFVRIVILLILWAWKLEKIYPQIMNDLAEREARGEL